MHTYKYNWKLSFDEDIAVLWEVLSDTSSLNRRMGMQSRKQGVDKDQLIGEEWYFFSKQRWIEKEWSWVYPKFILVRREYTEGFFHKFEGLFKFQRRDGKTQVEISFVFETKSFWVAQLLKFSSSYFREKYRRAILDGIAILKSRERPLSSTEEVFLSQVKKMPQAKHRLKFTALKRDLLAASFDSRHANALCDYFLSCENYDLLRIRPKLLARITGIPLGDIINMFIYLQKRAYMEMKWSVICPYCLGEKRSAANLGSLPLNEHCDFCNVSFDTGWENTVEISFQLSEMFLPLAKEEYCFAEAARKKGVISQKTIFPGEEFRLSLAKFTTLRLREKHSQVVLLVEKDAAADTVVCDNNYLWVNSGKTVRAKEVEIDIRNATADLILLSCDEVKYDEYILTPKDLVLDKRLQKLFPVSLMSAKFQLFLGQRTILVLDSLFSAGFYNKANSENYLLEFVKASDALIEQAEKNGGVFTKSLSDVFVFCFMKSSDASRFVASARKVLGMSCRASVSTGLVVGSAGNAGIDLLGSPVYAAFHNLGSLAPDQFALDLDRSVLETRFKGRDELCLTEALDEISVKSKPMCGTPYVADIRKMLAG